VTQRRWTAVTAVVALAAGLLAGCGGSEPPDRGDGPVTRRPPALTGELVQLRRDEALGRVEVGVTNTSRDDVRIQTIELRIPGYTGGGVQPKGEPLPAGQQVNLPTPYGEVPCPETGEPEVGEPTAVVQVRRLDDPTSYTVTLPLTDPRGLAQGIARSTCLARRLTDDVSLSFGRWRRTGSGDATILHGTLDARLRVGRPFDVTQLAGSVIFDLLPDGGAAQPLARLTPSRRHAQVPVLVRQARCDGHARGEIKKPYAFLVWIGPPGGEQLAVNPRISDADMAAFEAVCHLGWHQ
jgi:hypothetical protein